MSLVDKYLLNLNKTVSYDPEIILLDIFPQ